MVMAALRMEWSAESATQAYLDTIKLCGDYKRRSNAWKSQEPGSNEFISALAAGTKAKLIVEVASSVSSSTIALAAAARHTGGKLICILPEPVLAESKEAIKDSGLKDIVEFKTGDPSELLSHYGNIDFSLIDCKNDDYTRLLHLLHVNLERSVVVANNLVYEKQGLGGHVKGRTNKEKIRVRSTKHPIGKGMEITTIGGKDNGIVTKRGQGGEARLREERQDNDHDDVKRSSKSRWVVKVDEVSGEEHIFRVLNLP